MTPAYLIPLILLAALPAAHAQEPIIINETTPCFLDYNSSGLEMIQNCGIGEDFIDFALLPWEYITGGYFSMILVGIFVMFTYVKYQNMVYPMIVGILYFPFAYFLFPDTFITFAVVIAFIGAGILLWYTFVKQTKEY